MGKSLYSLSFALIALVTISNVNLFAMDPKTQAENQKQRFEKMFSEDTSAYLHSKQVSPELKAQLDRVFCKPKIEKALAALYDCYGSDNEAKKCAKDILTKNGFTFLISDKTHVYIHSQFPELVFKHSSPPCSERLHAGRIRYAQVLQEKNLCSQIRIKCPHKQAYIPYLSKEKLLPLVIVVVEKINILQLRSLSIEQFNALRTAGFYDTRPPSVLKGSLHNAGALGGDILVFDTEPLGAALNYPHKNKLITMRVIAASWLCMASWVAWKLLKN